MKNVYLPREVPTSAKSCNKRHQFNIDRLRVVNMNPGQFDDDGTLKITAGIVEGFYVAGESSLGLFDTQC